MDGMAPEGQENRQERTDREARRKAAEIELAWSARSTRETPERTRLMIGRILMRDVHSERQGHRCCWCGCRMTDEPGPLRLTLEHIVPTSRGGSDDEANTAAACQGCNSTRANSLEWLTRLPDWDDALLGDHERACSVDYETARAMRAHLEMEAERPGDGAERAQRDLAAYDAAYTRRFPQEVTEDGRRRWLREHNWTA